ncbi:MAG: transketolase [Clostridia bacterium]|nr:transketolase [Clostridia bacterium]
MFEPINAIKVLAIDQIANAKSGHLGMAISASPIVYALYKNILNIAPNEPNFINRDRVIFSAGHCSSLIYSILHLCGFNVTLDDLKSFRKYGSKTAGHPEYNICEGVDATTGPLGQGIAIAVGMAMAERHLASKYNKPNFNLIDHYTYVVCGEGCLMEGVSYEACSLAGLHKLNKLIIIYDCNKITMDGSSEISFNEDLCKRFEAQGFDTIVVKTRNSVTEITTAIEQAKRSDKPTFIVVPSIIGEGTCYAGTNKAHGSPLDLNEAIKFRESCGFSDELFEIDKKYYKHFEDIKEKGKKMVADYNKMLDKYRKAYKKEYNDFINALNNDFKPSINLHIKEEIAGRDLGQYALRELNSNVSNLFGGSADVMTSTKAYLIDESEFSATNYAGKNIRFGVREFAMSAICNGIALHKGLVPFCATFLAFSDYMKASIRLSALMKLKVIYIFTHDSICVGEDGPTHQPIEQLDCLRNIPNLQVFRPCCGSEVGYAYMSAYEYDGPTAIILSRNNLAILTAKQTDMQKGAYIVHKAKKAIANVIATGLEVGLGQKVIQELNAKGLDANLISIVNKNNFDKLTIKEKHKIINSSIKTNVVIEASSATTLANLCGTNGLIFNISEFGASGDAETLYKAYGFDAKTIAEKIMEKSFKNNDSIIPLFK